MNAGGPTKGANMRDIFLVRQVAGGKGVVERINFKELIGHANFDKNYILQAGDLIYVPETGLNKLNYFTSQIAPFFTVVGVTANTISGFGFMNGLSAALYGSTLTGGGGGGSSSSSSSGGSSSGGGN
jgi:uncharacterized membrane protein YgcG